MAMYEIPPDTRGRSKIIGGILTITQLIWVVLGVVVGGMLAMAIYSGTSSLVFTVLGFLIGCAPFAPFAFIKISKVGDMELFSYLMLVLKFRQSNKKFYNYNVNYNGKIKEV